MIADEELSLLAYIDLLFSWIFLWIRVLQIGTNIPSRIRALLYWYFLSRDHQFRSSSISRWWIEDERVGADCIHCIECETRSRAYQYTLITDMFPLARVPLRLWLVFNAFWCLAGETDPLPGSGVSFRFNWTSRIAPLPHGISLCACSTFWLHIVRCMSAYACALCSCFRYSRVYICINVFTPQIFRVSGNSGFRTARITRYISL